MRFRGLIFPMMLAVALYAPAVVRADKGGHGEGKGEKKEQKKEEKAV